MSRGVVNCMPIGGLGNQTFTYAFCRAYAERYDLELRINNWYGRYLWQVDDPPVKELFPLRSENDLEYGEANFNYTSYSQIQRCMIYSRDDAHRWFKWDPDIEGLLRTALPREPLLAHRRLGDYVGVFDIISEKSYYDACDEYKLDKTQLQFLSGPGMPCVAGLPTEVAHFLPDFWRMMHCDVLLRGNSTFSWWAAVLGTCDVYAPLLSSAVAAGNGEVDVRFVKGNHSRHLNAGNVTELHLVGEDQP